MTSLIHQSDRWDVDAIHIKNMHPSFVLGFDNYNSWFLADAKPLWAQDKPRGCALTLVPLQIYVCKDVQAHAAAAADAASVDIDVIKWAFCDLLQAFRPAGMPFVSPSDADTHLKSPGAFEVSSRHLYDVIFALSQHAVFTGFHFEVFKLGTKLGTEDNNYYDRLMNATGGNFGDGYLDLAVELYAGRSHYPYVAKPKAEWLEASYANRRTCDRYPIFPGLSQHAGGVTFRRVQHAIKAKIYPVWFHSLKALNASLSLETPNDPSRAYYVDKHDVAAKILAYIEHPKLVSGMRVELRIRGADLLPTWVAMREWLVNHALPAACNECVVASLDFIAVREAARRACVQAAVAGLFDQTQRSEAAPGLAPEWKREQWQRVLSYLGYAHKYWSRGAMNMHDQPWGPPAVAPAAADALLVGPRPKPHTLGLDGNRIADHEHLQPHNWMTELPASALSDEELAVFVWLATHVRRGGQNADMPFFVYYKAPWGRPLGARPAGPGRSRNCRSQHYGSIGALARVMYSWAGPDWINRFR